MGLVSLWCACAVALATDCSAVERRAEGLAAENAALKAANAALAAALQLEEASERACELARAALARCPASLAPSTATWREAWADGWRGVEAAVPGPSRAASAGLGARPSAGTAGAAGSADAEPPPARVQPGLGGHPSAAGGDTSVAAAPRRPSRGLTACLDADDGATDSAGRRCPFYDAQPQRCGQFDDTDFIAGQLCCACGSSGALLAPPPPLPPTLPGCHARGSFPSPRQSNGRSDSARDLTTARAGPLSLPDKRGSPCPFQG
jgi:hypothetical protein